MTLFALLSSSNKLLPANGQQQEVMRRETVLLIIVRESSHAYDDVYCVLYVMYTLVFSSPYVWLSSFSYKAINQMSIILQFSYPGFYLIPQIPCLGYSSYIWLQ